MEACAPTDLELAAVLLGVTQGHWHHDHSIDSI